jgi:hypothetical protein
MLMVSTTPSKHETNAADATGPLAKFRDLLIDRVRPVRAIRSLGTHISARTILSVQ